MKHLVWYQKIFIFLGGLLLSLLHTIKHVQTSTAHNTSQKLFLLQVSSSGSYEKAVIPTGLATLG